MSFTDRTPVTITVTMDKGALDALIDNPLTLKQPDEGAFFHQAVLRGVQALRQARHEARES